MRECEGQAESSQARPSQGQAKPGNWSSGSVELKRLAPSHLAPGLVCARRWTDWAARPSSCATAGGLVVCRRRRSAPLPSCKPVEARTGLRAGGIWDGGGCSGVAAFARENRGEEHEKGKRASG